MPRASMKTPAILATLLLLALAVTLVSREPQTDPRLKHVLHMADAVIVLAIMAGIVCFAWHKWPKRRGQ